MPEPARDYRSYLLRLWRTTQAGRTQWRVTLEDVRTHRRRHFASLEDMLAFLRAIPNENQSETRGPPEEGA